MDHLSLSACDWNVHGASQTVVRPEAEITFSSLVDQKHGLKCVYDNNQLGFLLLYDERSDDLWDSTGRSGGLNGTNRALWQQRLTDLRRRFPSIPYPVLPN